MNTLTHERVLEHLKEDRQLEETRFALSWLWVHFALEREACKGRGNVCSHWYYAIEQGYEASVRGEMDVIDATILCLEKVVEEENHNKLQI